MAKLICLPLLILILLFLPKTSEAASGVLINEITPAPSSGNDWVELYNSSEVDVDISSWVLDDEGTATDMLIIPQNTIISKKSFKLFFVSNRLNKDGDTVYLKNQQSEVDKYQYTTSETDISYARYPDGESTWSTCTLTPEVSNTNCQTIQSPSPEAVLQSPSTETSTNQSSSGLAKPKSSPSPSPVKSANPSNSPKAQVQGQKQQLSPQTLGLSETSPSPVAQSQDDQNKSPNKIKLAALFTGSGLFTIGAVGGSYLWYHKKRYKDKQIESAN